MLFKEWFAEQDEDFKVEIGQNPKKYMCTECTLEELEELDNKFINNPEG